MTTRFGLAVVEEETCRKSCHSLSTARTRKRVKTAEKFCDGFSVPHCVLWVDICTTVVFQPVDLTIVLTGVQLALFPILWLHHFALNLSLIQVLPVTHDTQVCQFLYLILTLLVSFLLAGKQL